MQTIFATAIIAMLVCTAMCDATCKTFKCGKVTYEKDSKNKNCTLYDDSTTTMTVQDNCDKNQTCSGAATEASVPDTTAGTCTDNPDTDTCKDDKKQVNHVPGDICKVDGCEALCHDKKACPGKGFCATDSGLKKGEDCAGFEKYCNVGLYCAKVADNSTCTAVLAEAANCTETPDACAFGYGCIATSGAAVSTCTKWNSVVSGNEIAVATPGAGSQSLASYCQSGYTSQPNDDKKDFCMPGPMLKEDTFPTQADKNGNCAYVEYTNSSKIEESKETTNVGYCGYNNDDKFYCAGR